MERLLLKKMVHWKDKQKRKPLIIQGARQVGKTWIMQEFGKRYFSNVVYINFDNNERMKAVFELDYDIKRILSAIKIEHGGGFKAEDTLLIFDEIQEAPKALSSLKYFYENAPQYAIVAAGSLLGVTLHEGTSFPVGKVEFMQMYPMSFSEFLIADKCSNLVEYINSINRIEKIPEIFFNMLEEKLKAYFIIGGMPEVVYSWVNEKDMERVNSIQNDILKSYESDFAKHVSNSEANKISLIWNSMVSQLAKENKKFLYQTIKEGARAREYEDALNWLNDANLIYKIYNVKKVDIPLISYNDLSCFKIYLNDVGLLRRMANLDSRIVIEGNKLFEEFKGALTENFVLNMLNFIYKNVPNYFTFDRNEIDFVMQTRNQIIPIEVKSGKTTNNNSLTRYNEKFKPNISVRFSMNNLAKDGNILNVPLFLTEYIDKLIDM